MKYEKLSTLIPTLTSVVAHQSNPRAVRELAISKIKDSRVNPTSKVSMIQVLTRCEDPMRCVYNLILKYEGKGVI